MNEEKKYGSVILDDNYKITRLDRYCLALLKKKERQKKDSEEKYLDWETIGYHGTLLSALTQFNKEILNDEIFEDDILLKDIIFKIQEVTKEVKNIISDIKVTL